MRRQKRRGLIFGLLALGLALFTGFLFSSQITQLRRQIGDMQPVIVAKTLITPRTLITPDMLEVQQIPRAYAHGSYLQSLNDVADRVATVNLDKGEILRQTDVSAPGGLEDGWRAISIGANPISVGVDRAQAGSRVDVLVSYETSFLDNQGQEVRTKRTVTMLNDIEVLGVTGAPQTRNAAANPANGANGEAAGQGGGFLGGGSSPTSPPASDALNGYGLRDSVVIVTLRVTPEQAQQLAYHDTFATDIRLAVRRNDDKIIQPLPPTEEEDFR